MAPPKQPAAGMRSIASFFAPKAKAPPKEQLPGIANGAIHPDLYLFVVATSALSLAAHARALGSA